MLQWAQLPEQGSQPRRGASLPVAAWCCPKPIWPAEESQDHPSGAALLLGLQHHAMWLRDSSSQPMPLCNPMGVCCGKREQQICWLSPALEVPAWWPLTRAFSSFCPSYSPNHLEIHPWEDAGWELSCAAVSEQFPAGKGITDNVWGCKHRRGQHLRLEVAEGVPALSSTQGSVQSWRSAGMDPPQLPWETCSRTGLPPEKGFSLVPRLMDKENDSRISHWSLDVTHHLSQVSSN